jgi:hypothetical protein
LISASTCAAAVPSWLAGVLAEAVAAADPEGWAPAVPVAGPPGRGDGEGEDAGGDVPVWRAAAGCGGTVTTAGVTAMAMPAGLPAQGLVAAPHPAVVVREATVGRPDAGPGEKTPPRRTAGT